MTDSTPPKIKTNNLLTTSMQAPTAIPQRLQLGAVAKNSLTIPTGSATGNPRNKCALQPGYSLMGWVRLGNTEEDLAGTHGRIIPVTSEELSKHNTREDAWLAIRGRVYNVTRYMDYHPGGVDELMRGVGRDATKLFDEVHAWVNYQQLLAKCFVGPLRNSIKIDTIIEASDIGLVKSTTTLNDNEIVPRFDWTQKRADITIYIYTRQYCNPGLVLLRKGDNALHFRIQINHVIHQLEFELQHSVDWPPKAVNIGSESGKVEVTLRKTNAELWTMYGTHQSRKLTPSLELNDEEMYDYEVMSCDDFNHDSYELKVKGARDTLTLLPIGYHVTIACCINGDLVRRSYTPVFSKFLHNDDLTGATYAIHLNFLIKNYAAAGMLSRHLRLQPEKAVLQLSAPKGGFKLEQLLKHGRIALLAAGSGLTPFLNLIEHLLKRITNRIENLLLMYFNKTGADIWCHKALQRLQLADERFHVINILSQCDDSWQGARGRISKELLSSLTDKNAAEYATFVAVCGPNAFNQQAEQILTQLHYASTDVHIFQG